MFRSWFSLALLAAESQHVIGLRLMKLVLGGSNACDEASLMVTEKMSAATEALPAGHLMVGASPASVVQAYRTKVRANSRRLLQG